MGLASKTGSMPIDRRRLLLPAACVLLAGFLVRPTAADQYDALNVVLGGSIKHDANLFRVPSYANPQSDTITTGYVGVRIDKSYAQQRFQLDVTETAYRYDKFSDLNFNALAYRGAWLWHLSPRVSGTLSADHSEALIPFSDLSGPQRNLRTIDKRVFNLDGWLFGGWHVLLGASEYEQKNSEIFLAQGSYRSVTGEAGVKYVAESGNSIAATRRSIQGTNNNPGGGIDFVNFIDNEFTEHESELKATWMVSGKSTLSGRLGWLERRNEHLSQRDFSGMTGQLEYVWAPTGKLTLNFSANRSIRSWTGDTQASYRVDDTLSFAPSWQISEKIKARLRAYRLVSDFLGPVAPVTGQLRRDTLRSVQVGIDWAPQRNLTISATLQRDQRSSNTPGLDFDATVASLSAALMF